MRNEIIRKYISVLATLTVAFMFVAIISWAVIQKPVEPQKSNLPQGNPVPLYIPPPSYS